MFPRTFLTAVLSLMLLKCDGFLMCDSDKDCQDGSSCIDNICKICIKCSLIFRKGKTCESDFNDCGDCLEGYKEISVTDNSAVKKPCRPMRKRGKLKECANDNNCPPNHYCSETTCVKCFDCSLLNRLEPERCSKDASECGPCLAEHPSIHYTSKTNYKCEKVPDNPVPFEISSGSVLLAVLASIMVAILFASYLMKTGRGFTSSKTTYHQPEPSAPPLIVMQEIQCIENFTEEECPAVGYERQEVQQAKVYKQPSAPYYYAKADGISETDSAENENSSVTDALTSAQREESRSPDSIVICGECVGALTRRLSEINSFISGAYSQDEQPVDMNVLNSDSAENNSHLVSEDPSQVPEAPASESTGDLSLEKGQV